MASHGTTTGYRNGCRCAECRAAWAAYSREYQRQLRERRDGGEHPNNKQRWTERDIRRLRWLWPHATVPEVAHELGRSCNAVSIEASRLGLKRTGYTKGQTK